MQRWGTVPVAGVIVTIVSSCTVVPLENSRPPEPPPTPFRYQGKVVQIAPKPESVPGGAGWAVQELVRGGPTTRGFIWVDESMCERICAWTTHITREAPLGEGCLISFDWIGLHVLSNEGLVVSPTSAWCTNAGVTHCQRYVSFETGPELITMNSPHYPNPADVDEVRGTLYCHVYVDTTGRVVATHAMSEFKQQFAEAALAAARTAVYKPARRQDKSPVAVWAVIPFEIP